METIDENNGWKLTSNKSIAKTSKIEIRNGIAVHKQEVPVGTPEEVRESVKKSLPNSKVEVDAAHNIQTFERESIKPVNHGIIKSYEFAVLQQGNIGDGVGLNPLESYDNTTGTVPENKTPSWMSESGIDNAETGEKSHPLNKGEYFLKNMWDKLTDTFNSYKSEHQQHHDAVETEEKEHRTALWITIAALGVISAAALIIGLIK